MHTKCLLITGLTSPFVDIHAHCKGQAADRALVNHWQSVHFLGRPPTVSCWKSILPTTGPASIPDGT